MKTNIVARRSLVRGAAQARRLNAQRTISQSVLTSTFHLTASNEERGPVQLRTAARDFGRGGLIIRAGEQFFLVESPKFSGRFYVLVQRDGHWLSSSDDARVTTLLVAQLPQPEALAA
jgi:hypothetical protein